MSTTNDYKTTTNLTTRKTLIISIYLFFLILTNFIATFAL